MATIESPVKIIARLSKGSEPGRPRSLSMLQEEISNHER